MKTITLKQANKDLKAHIKHSLSTGEEINIASENGAMVMLPQKEYEAIMETIKLLADKKSLKALLDSHEQRKKGIQPQTYSVEEVFSDI